jgi:four helix bundle protein
MQEFRNLKVWQKAHEVTLAAYAATANFPREEMFGLTSQIRRAASSVAANIAEGCGLGTDGGMRRSLFIALGSAKELDYHLLLACDLGYLTNEARDSLHAQITEVERMLSGLIAKTKNKAAGMGT